MAITSSVDICNMALGHLGNYGTISNIITPTNQKEITFALWYDISRQSLLKQTMPNFALARKVLAAVIETPPFGYEYAWEYPSDCLKVLGLNNIDEKENNYNVEGNRIYTYYEYADGLNLRYIKDIEDVAAMSPEFKMLLSWYLAGNVAMDITQDINKKQFVEKMLPSMMSSLSGLNAQENKPIRISHSRFKQSRYFDIPSNPSKY